MTQRQIKFRFRFSEHEPVVFTLSDLTFGLAACGYQHDWGVVVGMDEWTGMTDKIGNELYDGDDCKKDRQPELYKIVWDKNAWAIQNEDSRAIWTQHFCNGANQKYLTLITPQTTTQ